jgi:hypothetical protein
MKKSIKKTVCGLQESAPRRGKMRGLLTLLELILTNISRMYV